MAKTLPDTAPERGEDMGVVLIDFERLIHGKVEGLIWDNYLAIEVCSNSDRHANHLHCIIRHWQQAFQPSPSGLSGTKSRSP